MTTKIAVLTDVHANLPALQAALRDLEQEGYDRLIHTGDAIGIGPFPAETLETLLAVPNISFIMGNHDAWFAQGLPDLQAASYLPSWFPAHLQWTLAALNPDLRPVLAQWPYLLQENIEGVKITFLHYALDLSGRDFVTPVFEPTPATLDRLFADYDSDLIFYGHHHPFSDLQGRAHYINPGSLGCYTKAVARYALVLLENGQATIEHRSIPYDQSPLFQAYELRQVPGRETIYREIFGK
ncbi:MAG TPA: metallophosphoesterase family protein [Ktedonobacteraceae bacterium]|nr:metallophosphoesterase family protein [Ktedonobacteraceae bacterium]